MTSEFTIALHALVYLDHKACTLSSDELAENICTNPARVRKVMSKLKKAGLIATKEGAVGGYRFDGDPANLTLLAVADAVGSTFVAASWHSGDEDMECLVASGMSDIVDGLCAELDELCRRRLSQLTVADISAKIFGPNGDLPRKGR